MTCRQARQLLAAYRRHDSTLREHAELQAHLLECAACRAREAEFRHVGEAFQSLPKLAPPPDFYARVLAAVRADESQAAEQAKAAAQKKPRTIIVPGLTDVSHFPMLRRAVIERRLRLAPMRQQMSPAASFALRYGAAMVAVFLLFSIGMSLALLKLLPGSTPIQTCIGSCAHLLTSYYSPDPAYPLVEDATVSADGQFIIYAARNAQGKWMLEELDTQARKSSELLPVPVAGPLALEGWARSQVLWVQGNQGAGNRWELDATELSPALPGAAPTVRLLQGNVEGPDGWVTALHGIDAFGSTVLLAEELANGHGQLVKLDLAHVGAAERSVVATSQPDYLIMDPTTDGTAYYWGEQWQDVDGTLHGNIWRLLPAGVPEAVTSNDVSFSPMIVAGKLIWLEEPNQQNNDIIAGHSTPTSTPAAGATATPSGVASNSQVQGILWSELLDGRDDLDVGPKQALSGTDPVSDPQPGATFVICQKSSGDFYLYDLANPGNSQSLNALISNPLSLAVAPTAVLWVTADSQGNSQALVKTTINLLPWPQPQR
jgi:hypothetical protein